ncbi:iron complex outermembrane receptor protein [Zymomonas mobilis]|uniref:TonB-dependent receptor plug domain-containing protein n=1 Tax=Zymomonas mobilis TaxID=542 RepID=UPI000B37E20B|nr:TonB-dependent receptor [Zymomonas mobilis]ART94191.1 TonB-dependent receptor [Zymomonas mobilis subsp. mobilis]TWD60951.1 iron complex outermembrane receptor protein [Zymomonas mobilis]
MKNFIKKGSFFFSLSWTIFQYPYASFAAEQTDAASNNNGDAIIVTGTRETGKKARESISPIDIISAKQLTQTGMPSLRNALTQLLPSLSVPNGGYDSGALTDSTSLRGLNANETLVLVDGKRRHTTANLYDDSGPQQGTTPVDIDMIPMAAIDHIEVLRDGASAQYGSDAVAGVVNIILKKQDHGFHAQTVTGVTAAKDGFQQGVYLDGGTKLGSRGYLHVSGDFLRQNHSYRSAADLRTGKKDNKLLGQPEQTRESFAIKGGYEIADNIEAYGLATYAHRYSEAFENYRLASSLAGYPGYSAIYPNGYSPIETMNENDWEIMGGLKGTIKGWNWDVSSVYGRDYNTIGLKNSSNRQIEADTGRTPTTFKGVHRFNNQQWSNSIDFSKAFHIDGWPHEINVAGGGTHRYESYTIGVGSADSLYGGGSEALPGISAASAGKFSRNVFGGYFDVATHLVKQLQIDVAGRYEHYSDVGSAKTGKVALRYDPFKWLGFRGTISNAFHAPTLAQENYSAVEVSPTSADGIISPNSVGALANGSKKLKPEHSTNITAGVTFEPIKRLHITADLYQIKLRGQILPGGNVYGNQALNALAMNGFSLPMDAGSWTAASISTHWFANVANTRTRGIDITATYPTYLGDIGHIDWSVSANINRTILTHQGKDADGNDLLTKQSIAYITTAYPRSKIIWGGQFTSGDKKWIVGLHEIRWGHTTSQLSYYGGTANSDILSNYDFVAFHNRVKYTTNLDITYRVNAKLSLTAGANNLFNTYPSRVPLAHRYLGTEKYVMDTSQLGINGGFYYFKVDVNL